MPLPYSIPGPPGADGAPGGGGSIVRVQRIAELASLDPIELEYPPVIDENGTGVLLSAFGGSGDAVTGPYALVGRIVGPSIGGTNGQYRFFAGVDEQALVSYPFTFSYLATS